MLIGIVLTALAGNALAQPLLAPSTDAALELPSRFESMAEYKAWLQKTGRLSEFEQALTFANGMQEKSANGRPNTRAFWWETMLLQPVQDILPTGRRRPDLTIRYRSYIMNEIERTAIREFQILADNRYAASGKLYLRFDAWYNTQVVPAVNALGTQMTHEENVFLSNTKLPLGVYLAETVRLSNKYGLVSPTFSRAAQDAALTPAKPVNIPRPTEPRSVARANVATAATLSRQEEQRKEQVVTQTQIATRSSILTVVLVIIGAIGILLIIGYIQRIARRQM